MPGPNADCFALDSEHRLWFVLSSCLSETYALIVANTSQDRTNTLLNHIDAQSPAGGTSLQDFNDTIRAMENMSLADVRETQLAMALHDAEDSDDEEYTINLFQGYSNQELETLRQRQINQLRRYHGEGGRGEIPGVPAMSNNAGPSIADDGRAANTNADFDRMFHEINTCHVERFRE